MKSIIKHISVIMLICSLLVLAACGQSSSESSSKKTNVKIATVTWVGYAGIWLAKDLGYFDKEGLNVNYSVIDDKSQIQNALTAHKIDGMATTLDSFPRYVALNVPAKLVFALDHSNGADGIVSSKSITSVKDLKGKEVTVEKGSASEWFLANVLEANGMSLKDIKEKEMTASDAGAAFVAKKIDTAVTWEPWLSNAKKTDFGKVLIDSSKYPNAIVDVFGFHKDFIKEHPKEVKAFLKAYDKGVTYLKEHPEDAYKKLADNYSESADSIKEQLEGIQIMSINDSKELFGTSSDPGDGYEKAYKAADLWYKQGVLKNKVSDSQINKTIDPSFLNK